VFSLWIELSADPQRETPFLLKQGTGDAFIKGLFQLGKTPSRQHKGIKKENFTFQV